MMFHRLKLLSHWPKHEFFIFRCHAFAMSTKYASSVSMFPSGTSLTPSVLQASDGLSLWMVTCLHVLSSIVILPGAWLHFLYFHLLFLAYLKSTRYQKHFSGTSALPEAHNNPSHWVTAFCICWTTCLLSSDMWVMQRSVSSTNAKPENFLWSFEMAPINKA